MLAGGLMAAFGPRMFFWSITSIFSVIGIYILTRIVSKDALPKERQRRYVPFPARASSVAANLIPRRRRNEQGVPSGQPLNQ